MATYGCAAWTEEAVRAVSSFSPLIEIGAGKGVFLSALIVPVSLVCQPAEGDGLSQPCLHQLHVCG